MLGLAERPRHKRQARPLIRELNREIQPTKGEEGGTKARLPGLSDSPYWLGQPDMEARLRRSDVYRNDISIWRATKSGSIGRFSSNGSEYRQPTAHFNGFYTSIGQ